MITLFHAEERPWAAYGRGRDRKPITQRQVAGLLKPFGIRPGQVWFPSGGNVRGYTLAACADSFARYLPSRSARPLDPMNDAAQDDSRSARTGQGLADTKAGFAASDLDSSGLADRAPPEEDSDDTFSFDPDAPIPF